MSGDLDRSAGHDTELAGQISALLREVPDFPQPGIVFKDIAPLLADGDCFGRVIAALAGIIERAGGADVVAGVEARGFLVAGALARELGCGLVPVRKAGKLPPPTVHAAYDLEYGSAEIEVPVGVLDGRRVYLVDDVLATGGTLRASAGLLAKAGGQVTGIGVLVELTALAGRAQLRGLPPVASLLAI